MTARRLSLLLGASLSIAPLAPADDWPQWRRDAGRTGVSSQEMAAAGELHLQWTRNLPQLEPAFRDVRLQFDRGYEPVALGKRMFVASSRDDSLIALDTETGGGLWRFVAQGPIRFAPVAWGDSVYFGSDDGYFYCLDASDGSLRWKLQAVPSERKLLGNRRLISAWPVRGGPVIQNGRIYFAAGVWSFEGVFIYALDAMTGEVLWMNDDCGYIYGAHPHDAVGFGGLAPQGYLLVNGDELVVPSSAAYPARFDLQTGKLLDFQLPSERRKPGGWFVATGEGSGGSKLGLLPASEVARKRELLYEISVNQKLHEGGMDEKGSTGVRQSIAAGGQKFEFDAAPLGIEGKVHTMLAADGKLFVVTRAGELHCFGDAAPAAVVRHADKIRSPHQADEGAKAVLDLTGAKHGLAILLGLPELDFIETLASGSQLDLVAIDASAEKVDSSRKSLIASGLYGHRVAVRQDDPPACELPPYLASLVISQAPVPIESLPRVANCVRPFGGKLVMPRSAVIERAELPGFRREISGGHIVLTRTSLPGSTNYTGDWKENADQLVRAPVGVLWFDDALGHFKRSPQPRFVDGVMISSDKIWAGATRVNNHLDYLLRPAVYSDVYTGRILTKEETPLLSAELGEFDLEEAQPTGYRPPYQENPWSPGQPMSGVRKNPLTGLEEPRTFPKSYGCDGGVDYGIVYSMRSGTAAFYDKQLESGTINLSGPRSGCTNSIVPANGVLNVPYFFEGCTCSYPLPTALALVGMPKTHEQWSSWGEVAPDKLEGKIHRIGINFGAPGDRMTDEGTLWLEHPSTGEPSPQVRVDVESAAGGQVRYEYTHSLWIENGSPQVWPWVSGSAVIGAKEIRVHGLKNGKYEAKLFFAELEGAERAFGVSVQGVVVEEKFIPSQAAAGARRGVVLTVQSTQIDDGTVRIQLSPGEGETCLSGIELILKGDTQ